jgi:hypothetical protein
MGYTQSWWRKRVFEREKFQKVTADFARMLPALAQLGVTLAGPTGDEKPELTEDEICFNGKRACGHLRRELGLTWPAAGANGVCLAYEHGPSGDADISGQWCGGRLVRSRTCDGDCSYESFDLPRVFEARKWQEPDEHGRYFGFCKTAYRPYDLVVQVCLVIAAHHFGAGIAVSSDGSNEDWKDAVALCQELLGYGEGFELGA